MGEVIKAETWRRRVVWPLIVSSALAVVLWFCRAIGGHTTLFWFLNWNLFLAWLPLVFGYWLTVNLKSKRWLNWQNILLTLLWLGFLPNSFYLITDFVHLAPTRDVSLLFDIVMFMVFAWNGLLLGFISVMVVHIELLRRLKRRTAMRLIGGVLVLCSFAIYLGRYLAWNTWDIIVNPGGLLFDVSDRIVRPTSYPNTFTTTALFSVVLITLYYTIFKLIAALRSGNKR